MKIKKEFLLRDIMGYTMLVPINKSMSKFDGLITINQVGKFIWENIESSKDEDDLLQKILDEYEVEKEVAKADLDEFLQTLKDAEII